jgi:hypothetical protein
MENLKGSSLTRSLRSLETTENTEKGKALRHEKAQNAQKNLRCVGLISHFLRLFG